MKSLLYSLSNVCLILGSLGPSPASSEPFCKPIPSSANWPSPAEWKALNSSVSGRLIAVTPPGAVCHTDMAEFDNAACSLLQSQWANSSFHGVTPVSVDYNDDTCLPSAASPCSYSGYPAYVIAATSAADIQAGVRFAHKTGVRLTVKGTGHDVPGRSSGAGALNIWTHNVRGIEVKRNDSLARANGGVAAVKIAAGMRVLDVLNAAVQNNLTLVSGADHNVGIGGWVTGAGHGPVSGRYGLGADQVLEMEVVTADGTLLTINEGSQPDLFWAMRGGGGSTFAVLVSVIVRAFPPVPLASYVYSYNTTARSDTFWSLVATFHSYLPSLSESGAMGYYYLTPDDNTESNPSDRGKVQGLWMLPNKSQSEARDIMAPLESAIRTSNWNDTVTLVNRTAEFPDFSAYWTLDAPDTVGFDGRTGSRLLDKQALTGNYEYLKTQLQKTLPLSAYSALGHAVAGKGVREVKIPGGSSAVNPAWRKAYSHFVIYSNWTPHNATEKEVGTTELRNERTQALRDLAPDSGAYASEADPTEPNWQETFWGDNYPRLLQIKNKWDPTSVFWCISCVGNELWRTEGGDGIGQSEARICKG